MTEFECLAQETRPDALLATGIEILQVNVGLRCNMSCSHCHHSCSPSRTETMDLQTMDQVLKVAQEVRPSLIDVTGGSPEMHPHIKEFITSLRYSELEVQVRTNLTALLEPEQDDMDDFLASRKVRLLASFPQIAATTAGSHRGGEAYERSLEVLRRLARLGYGRDNDLRLDIAYNPPGEEIPDCTADLAAELREHLTGEMGIAFNEVAIITNMPIGRFRGTLTRSGRLGSYRQALRDAFNADTLEKLSCRTTLEVGWDGRLFDCDFNGACGLTTSGDVPTSVFDFDLDSLSRRPIRFAEHCFACAAQAGSG